jgi:hypothetical protein
MPCKSIPSKSQEIRDKVPWCNLIRINSNPHQFQLISHHLTTTHNKLKHIYSELSLVLMDYLGSLISLPYRASVHYRDIPSHVIVRETWGCLGVRVKGIKMYFADLVTTLMNVSYRSSGLYSNDSDESYSFRSMGYTRVGTACIHLTRNATKIVEGKK